MARIDRTKNHKHQRSGLIYKARAITPRWARIKFRALSYVSVIFVYKEAQIYRHFPSHLSPFRNIGNGTTLFWVSPKVYLGVRELAICRGSSTELQQAEVAKPNNITHVPSKVS